MTNNNFYCKRLQICFHYNFLFSQFVFKNYFKKKEVFELEDECSEEEKYFGEFCKGIKSRLNESLYKNIKVYPHFGEEGKNVVDHSNSTHKYYKPLLFLRNPHINVSLERDERITANIYPDNKKIEFEVEKFQQNIIMFESGAGACYFLITLRKDGLLDIDKSEIIRLTRLGQIRGNEKEHRPELIFFDNSKSTHIYELFYKYVDSFKDALNKQIKNTNSGFDEIKWIEIEKQLVYPLNDINTSSLLKNVQYFQDPYITLFLSTDDEVEKYFVFQDANGPENNFRPAGLDMKVLKKIHRDVASILLIASDKYNYLDNTYINKYLNATDGILNNISTNSSFFLQINSRITLAIISEHDVINEDEFLLSWISTAIVAINMLRISWYAYVITDDRLDEELKKLFNKYKRLIKDAQQQLTLSEIEDDIFKLKAELLGILEDPITYRTSSGSAIGLYEIGYEHFRIKELQNVVLNKLNELDKIRVLLQTKYARKEFQKEVAESDKWFLYSGRVALLLGVVSILGLIVSYIWPQLMIFDTQVKELRSFPLILIIACLLVLTFTIPFTGLKRLLHTEINVIKKIRNKTKK